MQTRLVELAGRRCLLVEDDQPIVSSAADATDLIGLALSEQAEVVAIPGSALAPDFFQLSSGLAGELLQKAANYRLIFAVLGDVSAPAAASKAFHDLVVESQRSQSHFFLPDLAALEARLGRLPLGRP